MASPRVVLDDADLEAVANGVIAGLFAAGGQSCVAGSRLIVQQSVEQMIERIVERMASDSAIPAIPKPRWAPSPTPDNTNGSCAICRSRG